MFDYIIIFILGSVGGFISGFLGVGGGIIYIPILDYFLSKMGLKDEYLVKCILANSLFTIIFSGLIASLKQYKTGNFFPKEIIQTAIPGVITAFLMTYLIRNGNWYSKPVFNSVFAIMLLIILVRMIFAKQHAESYSDEKVGSLKYMMTGFFAGLVTAITGLGGGVVMTPVINDVLKQNIKKASSISNGVIPLFAIAVGIYNLSGLPVQKINDWQIGYIIFPVILPMIFATFFFTPFGVRVSHRTKSLVIRFVFASFVTIVLIKTLYEIFFK